MVMITFAESYVVSDYIWVPSQVTRCSCSPQQLKINVFEREAAITAVTMGTSMSEPCIYDKLSERIDILRQSGYRYGMSEREIERFIKQVMKTNEPRREPPQFPILRATVKVRHSSTLLKRQVDKIYSSQKA